MKKTILKRTLTASICALPIGVLAACGNGSDGDNVTIEFAQWWGSELPDGALQELIDDFEEANPGITVELNSQPYANTRDQLVAGSASGTMPDVMGLDGTWIYDFAEQGSLADLSELYETTEFDPSNVNPIETGDGTFMIPVQNFAYPLFVNNELLSEAGIDSIPETWSEFEEAAEAIDGLGDNISGWALPLSLESAVGTKNDVLSWHWASGGSILSADGEPDLTNEELLEVVEFISGLSESDLIAPGVANMHEQDKVEEFQNGRVGMIISSLAHIHLIESGSDLDFSVGPVPTKDDFDGEPGVTYASWGIGIAETSEHKEEAWKLVDFLLQADTNERLSDVANGFPGNDDARPDFVAEDERTEAAYHAWEAGFPADEFVGLPVSEQLMRSLAQEIQEAVAGNIDAETALENSQQRWEELFERN